jgi:hypothetical protein
VIWNGSGEDYGIQKYFDSCLAAVRLVQGENKVLGSLSIYCLRLRREMSVFRTIGGTRGPIGRLVKAAT